MFINDTHLKKAHWFAKLSSLAYKNEEIQRMFFESEGIENHIFLDSDGTQASLYCNKGEIGIIFRGTEPKKLQDILSDLDIRKKKAKKDDGYVHAGFQESLDDVWPDVVKFIETYTHSKIYLSGHSLGAAVATLAAARLDKCTALYTFGSPRVGGQKFIKDNKEILHWRFVNNNDIVSRVPSRIRWKHHGNRVYIDRKGQVNNNAHGWNLFVDLFIGYFSAWRKLKFFDSFSDHNIIKYAEHIYASIK